MRHTEEGKAWGWETEKDGQPQKQSTKQSNLLDFILCLESKTQIEKKAETWQCIIMCSIQAVQKKKEEKISQNQCSYLKGKLTDKNRTKLSDSQGRTQLTVYYYQRGTTVFSQN